MFELPGLYVSDNTIKFREIDVHIGPCHITRRFNSDTEIEFDSKLVKLPTSDHVILAINVLKQPWILILDKYDTKVYTYITEPPGFERILQNHHVWYLYHDDHGIYLWEFSRFHILHLSCNSTAISKSNQICIGETIFTFKARNQEISFPTVTFTPESQELITHFFHVKRIACTTHQGRKYIHLFDITTGGIYTFRLPRLKRVLEHIGAHLLLKNEKCLVIGEDESTYPIDLIDVHAIETAWFQNGYYHVISKNYTKISGYANVHVKHHIYSQLNKKVIPYLSKQRRSFITFILWCFSQCSPKQKFTHYIPLRLLFKCILPLVLFNV